MYVCISCIPDVHRGQKILGNCTYRVADHCVYSRNQKKKKRATALNHRDISPAPNLVYLKSSQLISISPIRHQCRETQQSPKRTKEYQKVLWTFWESGKGIACMDCRISWIMKVILNKIGNIV